MNPVTIDDRKKELAGLLRQMRDHPERDWSAAKRRVTVLHEMIHAAEHSAEYAGA